MKNKKIVYFIAFVLLFSFYLVKVKCFDEELDTVINNEGDETYNEYITQVQEENLINSKYSTESLDDYSISYESHIQNVGWQATVAMNQISGVIDSNFGIEAIKIRLNNATENDCIEYKVYIKGEDANLEWVKNGQMSGTEGQGKQIEAFSIKLSGTIASEYDIYYRSYVENIGWLDWAKNGALSGNNGYDLKIIAFQAQLVKKNQETIFDEDRPFLKQSLSYESHVQNIGWQDKVKSNDISGTTGMGLRVEGIKLYLTDDIYNSDIEYQAHIQNIGWESIWHKNGDTSGTVGQAKQLEAIRIRLNGRLAEQYDIYYRVHVQNIGWLGWAKNGESAGTQGYAYRIEAYQVKLVKKGNDAPSSNIDAFKMDYLYYQSHVQNIGWQNRVKADDISGTTGMGLRVEGIKLYLNNGLPTGNIEYQTHIQNIGWESAWHKNGETSGTIGQAKQIEAIRIKLTGDIAEQYDIYYRVHVQNIGWLGWAKNGESAGTQGYSYRIEAYQVKMIKKGENGPTSTVDAFRTGWINQDGKKYYTFPDGTVATGNQVIDGVRYIFDSQGALKYSDVKVYVDISSHQGNIDFDSLYNSGQIDGVILRIGYWTSEDAYFEYYIKEIKRLNIPYTVYLYSYAHNSSEALEEAKNMLSLYTKYKLKPAMSVYYDLEGYNTTVDNSDDITKDAYQEIAETFIGYLDNNGIRTRIYSYYWFALNRFNDKTRSYLDWIAQYSSENSYPYSWRGWQYSDNASVPGINTGVDMSIFLY